MVIVQGLLMSGKIISFEDKEKMKSGILKLFKEYISGKNPQNENEKIRNKYSRQKLTGDMVELLNEMIKKK